MKSWKKVLSIVLAVCLLASLAACSSQGKKTDTADNGKSDQELADECAALIDAIYVQEWNDKTTEQCAAAKAAWDALTDAQKELVYRILEEGI